MYFLLLCWATTKQGGVTLMVHHKTVTISSDVYDRFQKKYRLLRNINQLPLHVNSLSGFLVYTVDKKSQEDIKLRKIASQIKIVPSEFLELKIKTNGEK